MKTEQRSLFELDPAPWDQDDAGEALVATVVFATGPQQSFDYVVPQRLRGQIEPGRRVRVPLGRGDRLVTGYCVAVESRQTGGRRLKPLHGIVDRRTLLDASMLRLTQWMAGYYLCSWGQVLEAVVPAGVRGQAGTREELVVSVPDDVAAKIAELKLPEKQARIVEYLTMRAAPLAARDLCRELGCTLAPIQTLRKKGLLRVESRRADVAKPVQPTVERETHLQLNADQKAALRAILSTLGSGEHSTILIHGVTGSGKTEVYIQAIQEVIGFGRQAIVLVPEISLTPQTEQRFRSRFGSVAVLHSHQTDVERHRHWEQIARGEVQVVVGARSAVFAPTPNLGILILDEEHETSFKQETAPRYHARDVAIERARSEAIPLVLGSATPSLESWHRATASSTDGQPRHRLVSMPRRVFDRPMPGVGTIDLRLEFQDRRNRGAVSRQLHVAMDAALKDGGQVILLLNRRGFSTHIQCNACGQVMRCPHCTIALTHHLHEQAAVCHYCDYRTPPPTECPECHFVGIHYRGLGTQRLEAEVRARFPHYPCLRMDTDAMQKTGSHEQALSAFRKGDVRILLGTQMIAKGLDFPNVTLVGVINADTALHLPDFRAAERTFQLVTQVAGRTGRGEKGGRVLVQTFSPEHPAIVAALRHDFKAFAEQELPHRQSHGYPPFAQMLRLVIRGPIESTTGTFAEALGERIRFAVEERKLKARVLGPAPAPIARLRGNFRYQIQTQSADGDALRKAVEQATAEQNPPDGIQWIVDVDPQDML